jgi:hypothetical protein
MLVLNDYPSASAIAYFDNKVYMMGDDASHLLITDTDFKVLDTITFFNSATKRIPKLTKQDPEAATIMVVNKIPMLLLVGSGSLAPLRSYCWIINLITKEKSTVSLDTFYKRLQAAGIKDLNIEGVATIPGGFVLSSRGNKAYQKNHLIFTTPDFWLDQTNAGISIAKVGVNKDTVMFNGISGLEYSPLTDRLLLTVSTENTYTTLEDGDIGKSYIWVINDISKKREYSGINPSRIIDLETIDSRFINQKIESICIISESKKQTNLILVADDDKGGSSMFKVELKE